MESDLRAFLPQMPGSALLAPLLQWLIATVACWVNIRQTRT
jgi:hypothetical protein